MSKIELGKRNVLLPLLPVLVGTKVKGKPNYITIALVGWLCYDAISVSVGHNQYSNAGIKENGTFSINQPTAAMVKELDYCGLYSEKGSHLFFTLQCSWKYMESNLDQCLKMEVNSAVDSCSR